MDYLTSIAQRAVAPATEVKPAPAPMFRAPAPRAASAPFELGQDDAADESAVALEAFTETIFAPTKSKATHEDFPAAKAVPAPSFSSSPREQHRKSRAVDGDETPPASDEIAPFALHSQRVSTVTSTLPTAGGAASGADVAREGREQFVPVARAVAPQQDVKIILDQPAKVFPRLEPLASPLETVDRRESRTNEAAAVALMDVPRSPPAEQWMKPEVREIVPLAAALPKAPPSFAPSKADAPLAPAPSETIVHVTIGRVEIRAGVAPKKPAATRDARASASSLEAYLRGASGRTP